MTQVIWGTEMATKLQRRSSCRRAGPGERYSDLERGSTTLIEVELEREYEFGAGDVWAVIANFGNVSWVPGIEKVDLEGEGVGMIRHLTVPVYPQLHERLETLDHVDKVLEYSIPAVEYISVKNYGARAQVIDLGPGRCRVLWSCKAEADGASEAEARAKTRAFYEAMLGWIDDYLKPH